jgi:hypothetical protein
MFHVANSMCMRVLDMWQICSCNLMRIFCYGLSRKLAILALQEKLRTASPTKAQGAWGSCLGGWFFGSEAELHGQADQCQACQTVKWNPVVGNGSEQAPEKSEYLQWIFKPALHDDRDQQSALNSENRSRKTSMIRYASLRSFDSAYEDHQIDKVVVQNARVCLHRMQRAELLPLSGDVRS